MNYTIVYILRLSQIISNLSYYGNDASLMRSDTKYLSFWCERTLLFMTKAFSINIVVVCPVCVSVGVKRDEKHRVMLKMK